MTYTHRLLVATTVFLVGLSATSCAPKESYSGQPAPATSEDQKGPRVVEATPRVRESEGATSVADARTERGNVLNERLVFFDLDKSVIKQQFFVLLDAHADFLVDNRNARVVLQGHADERGSTEYNLALGQRRADSVGEYLTARGVFPEQIETISYGEERPRALGSNEAAWAQNRRVEIVYGDE